MRYGWLFLLAGFLLFQTSTHVETKAFPPPAPPFDHPDLKKTVKPQIPAQAEPQSQESQPTYSSPGKSRRLFGRFRHR